MAFFALAAAAEEEEEEAAAAEESLATDLPADGLPTVGFLAEREDFDSNLNEPEAPLPLVWMSAPDSTPLLRYFLMNGANFSASTLY